MGRPSLAGGIHSDEAELLSSARILSNEDHGKTFYLNLAGGFQVTLPPPNLGLRMKFVVRTAPTTSYTIVTSGSANIMKGQGYSSDLNAAADVDFETAGGDTFTFVLAKALAGDWAVFESDGTSWFVQFGVTVFDAATITTAS